jgi:hypothetical protein
MERPMTSSSRVLRLAASLALTVGLAGCAGPPVAVESPDSLLDGVRSFLQRWNAAIAEGNANAVRSAYSDHPRFAWHEDGALRYRSREEIVASLASFPPGTRVQTELSEITVRALASPYVHVSAAFRTRIAMPAGPFAFSGVFTATLERTADGFVFVDGHTSTKRPESRR